MADITLKRGDTYPPFSCNLTDSSGASAIDLTTASSVHLEMKSTAGTLMASLGCTIPSPALGYVKHAWSATETAMVDTWTAELEILFANGGIQTVPNSGQFSIAIVPDIEGT
jgi:hypothetical protein